MTDVLKYSPPDASQFKHSDSPVVFDTKTIEEQDGNAMMLAKLLDGWKKAGIPEDQIALYAQSYAGGARISQKGILVIPISDIQPAEDKTQTQALPKQQDIFISPSTPQPDYQTIIRNPLPQETIRQRKEAEKAKREVRRLQSSAAKTARDERHSENERRFWGIKGKSVIEKGRVVNSKNPQTNGHKTK